jgi:hypothetical protein
MQKKGENRRPCSHVKPANMAAPVTAHGSKRPVGFRGDTLRVSSQVTSCGGRHYYGASSLNQGQAAPAFKLPDL